MMPSLYLPIKAKVEELKQELEFVPVISKDIEIEEEDKTEKKEKKKKIVKKRNKKINEFKFKKSSKCCLLFLLNWIKKQRQKRSTK